MNEFFLKFLFKKREKGTHATYVKHIVEALRQRAKEPSDNQVVDYLSLKENETALTEAETFRIRANIT